MTFNQVASALWPRLTRVLRDGAREWNRVGEQVVFFATTLYRIRSAVSSYKTETLRVIAQMSLGVGSLASIGGATTIVTFLTMNSGGVSGVLGHFELGRVGVDALGGFFSAYVNTRLSGPIVAVVGLSATVGAGATAQLGAMRINEEIDALEVMGIHPITYLASTRVVAAIVTVVPIFFTALVAAYLVSRALMVGVYSQSAGAYDHYFNTFLDPMDVVWATLQVAGGGIIVMLIHTYYGLTATGGPAGVGEATGRAVRASLVAAVFIVLIMSLVLYGRSGNFHLSA
ncbi:ABC transporter permease [Mycobacterium paraintracellulare]|uniref:ABC transporter permease n=1 Tax=Mycobacterium paraintracellulare TaxID=1138383 RepID=UPI001927D0DA|nr:ABC transporter permease [Mycobacterium paraintracellulare]BCP14231.1 integral membrane protein [Mycobacterium paraintracellulare]